MPQSWERMDGEPNKWFRRFEHFRMMGPNRTIGAVFAVEKAAEGRLRARRPSKTWHTAAREWDWRSRAEAWDEYLGELAVQAAEERRLEILSSGYALIHERVLVLGKAIEVLLKDLGLAGGDGEANRRWVTMVKGIGSKEDFERIEYEEFNRGEFEVLLKALDDLARETGGRVQQSKVSGTLNQASVNIYIPDNGRNDRAD